LCGAQLKIGSDRTDIRRLASDTQVVSCSRCRVSPTIIDDGMSIMDLTLEQRIRERAYELWRAGGCIDGHAEQHWLAAEREVAEALMATAAVPDKASAPRKPRSRATPTTAKPARRAAAG
jgi:hypothetical protein